MGSDTECTIVAVGVRVGCGVGLDVAVGVSDGVRVIPINTLARDAASSRCREAGFQTAVSIPVVQHERLMGEVDLFFHKQFVLTAAERSLLEALVAHLAGAMENLRLNALENAAR